MNDVMCSKSVGTLLQYNKAADRVTSTAPQTLVSSAPRSYMQLTASEDPIMQQLVMDGAGDVFATDDVLALLMCAPRAVDSFDVVVTKIGNKILLDSRDDAPTLLVNVNETASEPPKPDDGMNAPDALAIEATKINHRFAQQTLLHKAEPLVLGEAWPGDADAPEQAPPAKRAFKYRRFELADGLVVVVSVCACCSLPMLSVVRRQ
jgi:translation initiation factor 3 subunit D